MVCGRHGHCLWPLWFVAEIVEPLSSSLSAFSCSYGHSFQSILMKFCTTVWSLNTKTKFVKHQNLMMPCLYSAPILHPITHFQCEGPNTAVEAYKNNSENAITVR